MFCLIMLLLNITIPEIFANWKSGKFNLNRTEFDTLGKVENQPTFCDILVTTMVHTPRIRFYKDIIIVG